MWGRRSQERPAVQPCAARGGVGQPAVHQSLPANPRADPPPPHPPERALRGPAAAAAATVGVKRPGVAFLPSPGSPPR